ncbi:MAG: hypothetical protein JEZ06_20265 [Anaerolineaceae bacterium]|nr:hypothetical protein [Anaerolineaceae bacterium]
MLAFCSTLFDVKWFLRVLYRLSDGGIYRANTSDLGLAVDLGAAKLVVYLVTHASRETLATDGTMNAQIAFGGDFN